MIGLIERQFERTARPLYGHLLRLLEQAIARGDSGCRVVVYLRPTDAAQASEGREYFRS